MSWAAAGDQLALTIRQVQSDAQVFTMPISVFVTQASGATRPTVWNDRREQTFQIALGNEGSEIRSVSIDPEDWILKHVIDAAAHTVFELRQYTLHPDQRDALVDVFDDHFVEGR